MTKKAYWLIAGAVVVAILWDRQIANLILTLGLLWIIFDGK